MNSLRLKSIGNQWLQSCVQPASEVEGPPVERQLACVSSFKFDHVERELFMLILLRLFQVFLVDDEFVFLQSFRRDHFRPFHPESTEEEFDLLCEGSPLQNLGQSHSDPIGE